ncbi:MAG: transporter substrate-binding protein [Marmoricola sp.]|nr:transporter substrate-binding protein [Marmoricola sp.]
MRTQLAVTAVAVSALLISGCGATDSTSSGAGQNGKGSFTILVAGDGGLNYDPQTNAAPSSGEFRMPVFDTLVNEAADGSISAGLATAWNLSPDKLTLTLTLRKGVKFQDGSAFDADAVKKNIVRGQTDPKSVIVGQFAAIGSVDATSPDTVTLHLKEPSGSLLGFLAGPAGMMASPKAWANADFATHPIGTGPWEVSDKSTPGSDMVYTAFPGYWDPSVQKVDTVHVRIGTESTFIPSLVGNSAQAVMLTGAATDAKTLTDAGLPVAGTGISYLHLLYLNKSGVFADPRVRAAVSLAIDRNAICTSLLAGACTVTGQPLRPDSWAYDSSLAAPEQNIAQAKALLIASGHPNGFSFKAIVSSTGTQLQTELSAIQQMLAKVNIKMSTSPMPVTQLVPTFDSGAAQAYYSVTTGGADPAIQLASLVAPAYNPGPYTDPTLMPALAAATSASTQEERAAAYKKVSAAYQESVFNVSILNQKLQYATAKGVSGVTPHDPLILDARGVSVR